MFNRNLTASSWRDGRPAGRGRPALHRPLEMPRPGFVPGIYNEDPVPGPRSLRKRYESTADS